MVPMSEERTGRIEQEAGREERMKGYEIKRAKESEKYGLDLRIVMRHLESCHKCCHRLRFTVPAETHASPFAKPRSRTLRFESFFYRFSYPRVRWKNINFILSNMFGDGWKGKDRVSLYISV